MTPRPKLRAVLRLLLTSLLAVKASLLVRLRSWNGSSGLELQSLCNSVFRRFCLHFSGALLDLFRGILFPIVLDLGPGRASGSLSSEDPSPTLIFFILRTCSIAGVFSVFSSIIKLLVLFLPFCCLTWGLIVFLCSFWRMSSIAWVGFCRLAAALSESILSLVCS